MATVSIDTATLMAMEYFHTGQPGPARTVCDQVLTARPAHPQALLLDAWLKRQAGDAAGAEAAFRRLLAVDGAFARVPQMLPAEPGPRFHEPTLARLFGRDTPPVSDISDHVATLFFEAAAARPKLIVELGTRGGESTRALLAAAVRCDARMLSVDIDPCDPPNLPDDARAAWTFVQADDVAFGRERFAGWCAEQGLEPRIDVLFIDTSHLYEHTCEELAVWMPLVAANGTVLFHDTAMGHAYRRNDASIGFGWDNDRGVIRAIEEYLGRRYDETRYFVDEAGGWLIRHDPKSSGFTVLRRMG